MPLSICHLINERLIQPKMMEVNNYLIIGTKYYGKTLQSYFDTHKMHSGDLYQIFNYVKNLVMSLNKQTAKVSDMLLYAKTNEKISPDNTFQMSGNHISVPTLDLSRDFERISGKLNQIVINHFEI